MELNQSVEQLRKKGLGLAAISYDPPAVLKHFTERQNIRFPLLSDAESKTIREFGIFNEAIPKANFFYGIPHPVTFLTDRGGQVKKKYFEEDFRQRQTLAAMLMRDYGVEAGALKSTVPAKHVTLSTAASTAVVHSGQRVMLSLDVRIPKGFHVYAPGTEGYIPVEWKLADSSNYRTHEVSLPSPRVLFLKAIQEKVPVFENQLRIARDITIGNDAAMKPLLESKSALNVEGTFRYQACDARLCYPPETVPVSWTFRVERHDSERAPKELRR